MTLGFESYSYGRALGRKRVVVSKNDESSSSDETEIQSNPVTVPLKRMFSGNFTEKSRLESLPQDLLVRVLCGVDHSDLDQLFFVSTTIREASEVAKKMHFEFNTPKKSTVAVHSPFDIEFDNGFDEIEVPNAPLVLNKSRPRVNARNLAGISVNLFC